MAPVLFPGIGAAIKQQAVPFWTFVVIYVVSAFLYALYYGTKADEWSWKGTLDSIKTVSACYAALAVFTGAFEIWAGRIVDAIKAEPPLPKAGEAQ